ncbi:hypothetical protein FACS1894155_12870 [Bacteroidia bacterium]|nr:hypothetical protein FACS1894155_12870 [Bacteroidia bacterium]
MYMKKIIYSLILSVVFLGFYACEDDNYDMPDETFRGKIIDKDTGETLQTENGGNGTRIRMMEYSWSDNPQPYNKDLFAIPGKVNDIYSQGCNKLIKEKKAALVENAEDILREMCWKIDLQQKNTGTIQRKLPIDLPPEQQQVINILAKSESIHLNILSIELNLPVSKMSSILFDMELDGIVKAIPGGLYKLF